MGVHGTHLEVEGFNREHGQVPLDHVGVGAGLDQRAERHVAGDAGDAVEVEDPHGPTSVSRAPATRLAIRKATCAAPNPLSMFTTLTPGAHEDIMASNAVSPSNDAP